MWYRLGREKSGLTMSDAQIDKPCLVIGPMPAFAPNLPRLACSELRSALAFGCAQSRCTFTFVRHQRAILISIHDDFSCRCDSFTPGAVRLGLHPSPWSVSLPLSRSRYLFVAPEKQGRQAVRRPRFEARRLVCLPFFRE